MKKSIIILLLFVNYIAFSQNCIQCPKTIDTSSCKVRIFNSAGKKIFELNGSTLTYTRGATNEYIIKDGLTQVTVDVNNNITSPTFANLGTFLNGVQSICGAGNSSSSTIPIPSPNAGDSLISKKIDSLINVSNGILTATNKLDSTQTDTSLINYIAQLDSLKSYLNKISLINYDTTQVDTSLIQGTLLNSIIDSLSALINKQFDSILTRKVVSIDNWKADTTHQSILQQIQDTLISKLALLDKSDIDTSLMQHIQLKQIIDSLSLLISKSINDTTHTYILNEISYLISKLDTSSVDTPLVAQIDYTLKFDSLQAKLVELITIASKLDSSQIDTSLLANIDYTLKFDSVLIKLNELVLKVVDTTQVDTSLINYITQLDSIIYYLKNQSPADTITHKYLDSILHRQDTICLPSILQVNDSLNYHKLDTLGHLIETINNTLITNNNYLLEIRNKADTTNLLLTQTKDSLANTNILLSNIYNDFKKDCIGSNETYYINGTNNVFINSSEVCSYTITVIDGEVSYTENGVTSPFDLPVGYTGSASFKNGANYLINSVSFTGVSGSSKAIIKVIK